MSRCAAATSTVSAAEPGKTADRTDAMCCALSDDCCLRGDSVKIVRFSASAPQPELLVARFLPTRTDPILHRAALCLASLRVVAGDGLVQRGAGSARIVGRRLRRPRRLRRGGDLGACIGLRPPRGRNRLRIDHVDIAADLDARCSFSSAARTVGVHRAAPRIHALAEGLDGGGAVGARCAGRAVRSGRRSRQIADAAWAATRWFLALDRRSSSSGSGSGSGSFRPARAVVLRRAVRQVPIGSAVQTRRNSAADQHHEPRGHTPATRRAGIGIRRPAFAHVVAVCHSHCHSSWRAV